MMKKLDIPWNEKTSPGPVPGPIKLTVPWDEAAAKLIPGLELPKSAKREKPGRKGRGDE